MSPLPDQRVKASVVIPHWAIMAIIRMNLDFEIGWKTLLQSSNPSITILNVVNGPVGVYQYGCHAGDDII
jgi:hypothetical protein